MDEKTIEIQGFTFRMIERDGVRFLESTWPETVPFASLSVIAWRLLELWDEEPDIPTVTISDLSRVTNLSDKDAENLGIFTSRIAAKPNHFLAAWFAEANPSIEFTLRRMVTALTGSDRGVFASRDEAHDAIARAIAR
ncbi:MAG TPA: hypothetical protein PLF26_15755, partial [Blastocatellia bacterium]|nr:hypothetical protein [Blastocatellia bacterium]